MMLWHRFVNASQECSALGAAEVCHQLDERHEIIQCGGCQRSWWLAGWLCVERSVLSDLQGRINVKGRGQLAAGRFLRRKVSRARRSHSARWLSLLPRQTGNAGGAAVLQR